MSKKKKTIVTHDGKFHADDVLAVASIMLVEGDMVNIVRTRDPKWFETGDYVVDVGLVHDQGKNRFDHHQEGGAGRRELNGVPYASFGLVWKKFGEQLCGSKEIADRIDERLVQPVDLSDNGVSLVTETAFNLIPYNLYDAIDRFNPKSNENLSRDKMFIEVVAFAKVILGREIVFQTKLSEDGVYVKKIYNNTTDKRLIILDGPYKHTILEEFKEPLFVIKKSAHNSQWVVSAVRRGPLTFSNRKKLPQDWGGKEGQDLSLITGVSDAVFCHKGRFMCVAGSKEGAITLAKKALES